MDDRLRRFTTADLNKHIGTITGAAMQAPVVITHHRRPRFVLMSIGDYETIANQKLEGSDPRLAFTLDDIPAELEDGLLALAAAYDSEANEKS